MAPSPFIRAAQHIALMYQLYPADTISAEGVTQLFADFIREGNALNGHYLPSLPEEQPFDTLVCAVWFQQEGSPDAFTATIYHQSTGRIEYAYTTGNWPTWLTRPVQRARMAAIPQ